MSSSINIDKSEVGVLEKETFVELNESNGTKSNVSINTEPVVIDRTCDVNHVEPRVVQSGGSASVTASVDLKTNDPININLLDEENNEIEKNSYDFSNFLKYFKFIILKIIEIFSSHLFSVVHELQELYDDTKKNN